jgi:threonine/homoserine/homoserine lactone efflux protein
MNPALFAGLLVFAIVSSATPGPNNLMMMASGATFGLKRTLPHAAGVVLGFGAMTAAVGLGVAQIFNAAPWLYAVLRWGSAAYLLYIAYRMVTAKGAGTGYGYQKPMSFLGAVGFQWINPKAWVMALAATTTYAEAGRLTADVLIIALTFMLVNVPCALTWTTFGVNIRKWLKKPHHLKAFNWTMAALLIASLYPLVTEPLGADARRPDAASLGHPPVVSPAR